MILRQEQLDAKSWLKECLMILGVNLNATIKQWGVFHAKLNVANILRAI